MLEKLSIRHYALIDDAEIAFQEGLSVLTGETGAGKSIILGALSLLLGDKAESASIRNGCDSATVSALFSFASPSQALFLALKEMELEMDDGTLVISRTIRQNGRTAISIQGVLKTKTELQRLSPLLIDISAQRDHQSLFLPKKQREVLDSYAKDETELDSYASCWKRLQEQLDRKQELSSLVAASKRESDYLSYAVEEIEKAALKEGEDDEIATEVRMLSSYEQIHDHIEDAVGLLHGGEERGISSIAALQDASRDLNQALKGDQNLKSLADRLESASIECQDIYETLRDYLSEMSFSQERLDQLQGRAGEISRLKKKYGPSLEDVASYLVDAKKKLEAGESGETRLKEIDEEIAKERKVILSLGASLTLTRKKAALKMGKNIQELLHELGMEQAIFTVGITPVDPSPWGMDEITFSICANVGMESRPISMVASGGELSRILLALKAVLDSNDPVPTLVFDEVDSGIGGKVANAVGRELTLLGKSHQVLAITHLASIAAMADHHLLVEKSVEKGSSYTRIRPIVEAEREKEIARMLSGDDSEVTLAHARQLLQN